MKTIFDPLSMKVLIIICLILAAISIKIGFQVDAAGFASNIMAEFTGFFIGIVITVVFIDNYTQHNREKQWAKVKKISYMALNENFIEMLIQLCTSFKQDDIIKYLIDNRISPNKNLLKTLDQMVLELKPESLDPDFDFDSIIAFYNNIEWNLHEIRTVLIPRILQSSSNQEILDALVDFDYFIMNLEYLILSHKHIEEKEFCHGCIIELVEKIKDIYSPILNTGLFNDKSRQKQESELKLDSISD